MVTRTTDREPGPRLPRLSWVTSRVRHLLLAVLLVLAGLVWLRINGQVEGRVLLALTRKHGITVADLLSVAAFAGAAVLAWPERVRDCCR